MEVAVGTAAGKIAPKLFDFLETNRKLRRELEHDIEYIKREFVMISAVIEEDGDQPPWNGNQVHKAWIQIVRDLSHAIEDCIDNFMHRVTLHSSASWIHRRFHRVKTVGARNKFAAAIRRLRKRSEDASKMRTSYITNNGGEKSNTMGSDEEEMEIDTSVATVGMNEPLDELMELISEGQQPKEEHKLKVISVVGFGGIGKTLLARQAYNDTIEKTQYEAWAWVRAADKDAGDVLKEILQELHTVNSGGSLNKLRASLREYLGTKRFFIVIDDMRALFWHDIKDAFPVVPGVSSRVMVTTAIQSVANACSSTHGHAYVMRTLDEEHSRQLFFQKASVEEHSPPLSDHTKIGTSEALMKCDGLPLALVSTAQFLQSKGHPKKWANLCENLGGHLETEDTLASMNRVLIRSYGSLGSQDVKTCLLYLGIYPSGHPIRRGMLIRRWLAEGFIKQDYRRNALCVAVEIFDELVDRSIIQPIGASCRSNSVEVKKCQTHGMMLEFILHKSMCENFVTLLCDQDPKPNSNIRWLSLQHRIVPRAIMNAKDVHLVRSLTIFGKAHSSMLHFSKYKLMRVLDLEECKDKIGDSHLKEICNNLLLIRYLSLGGAVTVTTLPKEIKKLKLLETLDVRRTNIEILPTEVMKLPCLVHLFGKFKFQEGVGYRRMLKLQTWLKNKSKMETVAGFVVDERQEMPRLIEHMEHLTKMKIWCESTPDASINISHLSKAIKGFLERSTNLNKAHSLSLNFNSRWPQDLLCFSLEKDKFCYLRSLKLQGNKICRQLPLFVTNLYLLTKLCLSFPGHNLGDDILDALTKVRGLEHLKLIATQMDKLIIRQGAFGILQSLCIMVEVMTGLEIEEGAVQHLDSLQLLCKNLNGFSSTTIHSLPLLKEVALHDELSNEIKQDWKGAAKNHPRRPKVLFKLKGSELAAGTRTAPTTTNTLAQEAAIGNEPAENFESPVAPPTDITVSTTPGDISTEESVPVATSEMGSESAPQIFPATTTTDTMTQEVAIKSEPAQSTESPLAPPTDMMLSVTMPPSVVSNEESVPVATSEMGSESAQQICPAATTTDTVTQEVATKSEPAQNTEGPAAPPTDTMLSVTMSPGVVSNEEFVPVAISEMGNESAPQICPAATTTDTMTEEVATKSEPPQKSGRLAASPTDMMLSVTITPQAISNGESVQVSTSEMGTENAAELPVAPATTDDPTLSRTRNTFASAQQEYPEQVDGDGQHDDHQAEDTNNFHEQNDLVSENGLSSNMASFKNEMEGVAV
ncbi:Disease resistance protein RPP13 [Hordeum vulgare]|nr:Disease resistance protein RPP13 [Hordeum vulgare]